MLGRFCSFTWPLFTNEKSFDIGLPVKKENIAADGYQKICRFVLCARFAKWKRNAFLSCGIAGKKGTCSGRWYFCSSETVGGNEYQYLYLCDTWQCETLDTCIVCVAFKKCTQCFCALRILWVFFRFFFCVPFWNLTVVPTLSIIQSQRRPMVWGIIVVPFLANRLCHEWSLISVSSLWAHGLRLLIVTFIRIRSADCCSLNCLKSLSCCVPKNASHPKSGTLSNQEA